MLVEVGSGGIVSRLVAAGGSVGRACVGRCGGWTRIIDVISHV